VTGPIQGIKILDMSRVLAGPWAGQLLGDYGADVVKIERPGLGDDTRQWGPPWLGGDKDSESAYFLSCNRNKRSLALDIAKCEGQRVLRELVTKADVLIENFKIGTMSRYGLGADELLQLNPGLIYCSISAYGQHGSRAAEPGYDAVIQASAGLMSITGEPEEQGGSPQKVGVAVCDIMAGMYAVTAILAALNAREKTGKGQRIDVPLYDSQVAWLANQSMNFLIGGMAPQRLGTGHPNLVPYQVFATADGHLMLAVGNDRQFRSCVNCLGHAELADDPRFRSNAARVEHREALVNELSNLLGEATTKHWLQIFAGSGVPVGPINSIADVLSDQYAEERNLVRTMQHPVTDALPTVSNPVQFSYTSVSYRCAPPLLGQHSEEVLAEWLNYSKEQIEILASSEAI
jgi:crotonobetainyl-CoA:carnitine CoA-transferase CaiB-like acyl-CoA transferase